jgi:hypothetical protein
MADMTPQEALAALRQVYNAYLDLVIQSPPPIIRASERLRGQGVQALFRLSDVVHGPCQPGELFALCDGCHLRRSRHVRGSGNYCDTCLPLQRKRRGDN